jgi:UDP-N-acetylglucosamine/UDP-N-acetylgalactosamine diphosphorylase
MDERRDRLAERLEQFGQGHVLAFADTLGAEQLQAFLDQLEGLDLERVDGLIRSVLGAEPAAGTAEIQPCDLIEHGEGEEHLTRDKDAAARGEELLAQGKVAAFVVAGGQGTRLGYSGPKGRFPVGPLTNRSLFAYHAHRVLATSRRYGTPAPFYVMTSSANRASTEAAFEEAGWFGLERDQVFFLQQGMLPAVDRDGRLLLAGAGSLSMSPDGHGGSLRALSVSGALDDMSARGVEEIFYFQVDNPLTRVLDPVFIGLHAGATAEMSTKVVAKRDPAEKVGVLAQSAGRVGVIEYSDLHTSLAEARDEQGRLRFRAGNIAVHVLRHDFVARLTAGELELPVHRADKAVPFLDVEGSLVHPSEPNAVKMEMFVFDALGFAERVVTQEVLREDEFAPVKNAEGSDSPETARDALIEQGKRWMSAAGLSIPEGPVEVGPLFALDREEFLATLTRSDFGPVFDRS